MEYTVENMERDLAKVSPNECPKCGEPIDGNICKKCGESGLKEHFYDPDYENYEKEIEKSNKEFFENMEWEEIPDA
jgi:hypothetical protein